MKKYRKKKETLAIQFDGNNFLEIEEFFGAHNFSIMVHTREGDLCLRVGDYVAKDKNHWPYPIEKDVFVETYEEMED